MGQSAARFTVEILEHLLDLPEDVHIVNMVMDGPVVTLTLEGHELDAETVVLHYEQTEQGVTLAGMIPA